jgi:4-amino-4-deoxy-L-arabinose transferase-like glycosyltransferase
MSTTTEVNLLGVIVILAFVLRLGVVIFIGDWSAPEGWEYGMIARNMLDGEGYSGSAWFIAEGPTAFMAPGYVFVIYGALSIFGSWGYLVLQVMQCIVGAACAGLTYGVAKRALGQKVALVSALLVACNPTHVYLSVIIHPLAITCAAVLLIVFMLGRVCDHRSFRDSAIMGICYGIALLVEPSALCLVPVILLWPMLSHVRERKRSLLLSLTVIAVAAAVVSPWTVRNYMVFDAFIPIKTPLGYILWVGNHEGATGTQLFVNAQGEQGHVISRIPEEVMNEIKTLPEPKAYAKLGSIAKEYMMAHPIETTGRTFKKALYYWWFPTWITSPEGQAHPIVTQLKRPEKVVWFLVLLTAIPGLYIARRQWRQWAILVTPMACFTALYAITNIGVGGPRYRIPIETLVMVFSAVCLLQLFGAWRDQPSRRSS